MNARVLFTVLASAAAAALPAAAYDPTNDYAACTTGSGKIGNEAIVEACTNLIDNSQKENELVGMFYALRAASNDDKEQNCSDAHKVLDLVKDQGFIDGAKRLIEINC